MPEASKDAAILIATSYQALKRAENGDKSTEITNSIVIVLFAGFFIEENLSVITKKMKKHHEMTLFFGGKKNLGLLQKLAWFYNSFVKLNPFPNQKELFKKDVKGEFLILEELEARFPGFREIYEFRNSVAHGEITRIARLKSATRLRTQAKAIVNDLFKIASKAGYEIPRNITYQVAITTPQ